MHAALAPDCLKLSLAWYAIDPQLGPVQMRVAVVTLLAPGFLLLISFALPEKLLFQALPV